MTRICDLGLGIALPFHAHVGMNAVISDYVPYAWRSASHSRQFRICVRRAQTAL